MPAVYIVLALIGATAYMLFHAGALIERRWNRLHPPDDWDGCREDKLRDE